MSNKSSASFEGRKEETTTPLSEKEDLTADKKAAGTESVIEEIDAPEDSGVSTEKSSEAPVDEVKAENAAADKQPADETKS